MHVYVHEAYAHMHIHTRMYICMYSLLISVEVLASHKPFSYIQIHTDYNYTYIITPQVPVCIIITPATYVRIHTRTCICICRLLISAAVVAAHTSRFRTSNHGFIALQRSFYAGITIIYTYIMTIIIHTYKITPQAT